MAYRKGSQQNLYDPTTFGDEDLANMITGSRARTNNVDINRDPGSYRQLTDFLNEQTSRKDAADKIAQDQQLKDLLGGMGGGQVAPAAPQFDLAGYEGDLQTSASNQRKSLDDIFASQRNMGMQGLDEQYNPIRKNAIEEAGVLGNLRSPAFAGTTLANIDASRSRDSSNLMGQLGAARGQAGMNLEQGLAGQLQQGRQFAANQGNAQQGLNLQSQGMDLQRRQGLAGLLQGNNQFGQTFGLQNRQFQANQGQQGFENNLNLQGLNEASRLGEMQANASKKTDLEQFAGIAGGLGGLAGGVGTLMGGFNGLAGGLTKPRQPQPLRKPIF